MKTKLPSFVLLTLVCICTHLRADENEKWAVGRWLLISVTNSAPVSEEARTEIEKQMMIFHEDGSIKRYSKETGFTDLVFKYKTIKKEIYLQVPKNKYLPAGHLKEDGTLAMNFQKGRIVIYKRISPLTPLDEIDFDGVIKIQFKQNKSANQNIEPTVKTPVE
jgi:hypothetical protein